VTAVRLQTTPTLLSVAFGAPSELRSAIRGNLALFPPNRVVGYFVRHPPWQALYLFRTSPAPAAATRLRGVSKPVNLLYIAQTRRTVDKTTVALNVLKQRIGLDGVDALPDLFWFQLADFIERRGQKIVCYVTRLLDRHPT
jgi:hypothetical protein